MKTKETLIVHKVSSLYLLSSMKEDILNKASELFINQGFKSVTMDDIANELALSKKTLYQHFANKETIVAVSVDAMFEEICSKIDIICDLERDPIEEMYDIKKEILHHLKDEKSAPMHQLLKYYPKIYRSLRARQFSYMQDCVMRNVRRGLEQGVYRANINEEFVCRIYFLGVTGTKDGDLFPTTLFSPGELYETYLEYHLRGIVTPKGRKILNTIIQSNHD